MPRVLQAKLSANSINIGAHLVVLHFQLFNFACVLCAKYHADIRALALGRILRLVV